ncbi:hypothetical protein ACFL4W_01250 [Planctomycetota bacterium]
MRWLACALILALVPLTHADEIDDKLSKKVTFDFLETPLTQVQQFLSKVSGVTLKSDALGVPEGKDHPNVTLRVDNMRLENALFWIAHQTGLVCGIKEGAIVFSSAERLPDHFKMHAANEQQEEWHQKIMGNLDRKVSFDFKDTPLEQMLMFQGKICGIPFIADSASLQKARAEKDELLITYRADNASLIVALTEMLDPLGFRCALTREAVLVFRPELKKKVDAPELKIIPPAEMKLYYFDDRKVNAKSIEAVIATVQRAAKAGYTAVAMTDTNFERMALKDDTYFDLLRRLKAEADKVGAKIIPRFGSLGYGNGFLKNDQNLAEGMRVEKALFKVKGNQAIAVLEPETILANGGFDEFEDLKFKGLAAQDKPGRITFADTEVKASGRASLRIDVAAAAKIKHGRVKWLLKTRPWHNYRLWLKIKTQDLKGTMPKFFAESTKGWYLSRQQPTTKSTQDWTEYGMTFNSWDNTEVELWLGVWGGSAGTVWIDEVRLESAGLLNVLRRPGCPVKVEDRVGNEFEESKDYAPIRDPNLNVGKTMHAAPPLIIPAGSAIPDGMELLVSYYTPQIVREYQVSACPSEPKVYATIAFNLGKLKEIFEPDEYLCSLDEVRLANHCAACRARKLTTGQLMGETCAQLYATLKKVDPEAEMIVWSDMFDATHNAKRKNYYYNPDSCDKSWEPVPRQVIIGNWRKKRRDSQEHFQQAGFRQIFVGYYDKPVKEVQEWVEMTADLPGIIGVMYTSYTGNLKDLEAYADMVRTAKGAAPNE